MGFGQLVALLVIAGVVLIAVLRIGKKPEKPPVVPPAEFPVDNPPIVYAPGIIGGSGQHVNIGDPVSLDLRHRIAGCDAEGTPTLEYGAYDPEGKILRYKVLAEGPTADGASTISYAVFNDYGIRIDDKWLIPGSQDTFAVDRANAWSSDKLEAVARCRFFVGLSDDEPPYAMKSCAPETKTYQCPSCGTKADLATQQTPKCPKCQTLMNVYIAPTDNTVGRAEFQYIVSDGVNVVESPTLEFIVHNPCSPKKRSKSK